MVKINKAFATKAEAEAWAASYKREYHPCGYGTTLDVKPCHDGTYVVQGYRFNSCD